MLSDAARDMLRVTGDVLDVGVLIVDRDLRIIGWNEWLEKASGITARDLLGRELASLVPDPLSREGLAAFERALAGGTVIHSHRLHRYLIKFPPHAGRLEFDSMQQSVRVVPLADAQGHVSAAVAFIEDVTDRVAAEQELRNATRIAEAANKAKSDFLASMSHELRTPIGAITGYADLLIEGMLGPMTETQRDHLARIKNVGDHLLRIVDEILSFARIEARGESIALSDVDGRTIVRDAATAVEPLARRKGLAFDVRLPDTPVPLRTDETKVRQIVINLLGNAVKFTERGRVLVELSALQAVGVTTIAVGDTGIGLAPQDLDRIFEPFVQAAGPFTRAQSGTGLGLAVSRQLARLLGGDVSVQSELGTGSTFILTLPVSAPAPAESQPKAQGTRSVQPA
jgi:PAS domain S-box-containing protein